MNSLSSETRLPEVHAIIFRFLYVTLEHLKRIEGETFDTLDSLGEHQTVLQMAGETVDPHQLLGLEIWKIDSRNIMRCFLFCANNILSA